MMTAARLRRSIACFAACGGLRSRGPPPRDCPASPAAREIALACGSRWFSSVSGFCLFVFGHPQQFRHALGACVNRVARLGRVALDRFSRDVAVASASLLPNSIRARIPVALVKAAPNSGAVAALRGR